MASSHLRVATLNIWNRSGPWPERLQLIREQLRVVAVDLHVAEEQIVIRVDADGFLAHRGPFVAAAAWSRDLGARGACRGRQRQENEHTDTVHANDGPQGRRRSSKNTTADALSQGADEEDRPRDDHRSAAVQRRAERLERIGDRRDARVSAARDRRDVRRGHGAR